MNMQERASLRNRHIVMALSLPLTLVEVCDRYADSIGSRTTTVIKDLIREGLRQKAREVRAGRPATVTPIDRGRRR
jgi:hypothetical protein